MSAFHFQLLNDMKRQLSIGKVFCLFSVARDLGLLPSLGCYPFIEGGVEGEEDAPHDAVFCKRGFGT